MIDNPTHPKSEGGDLRITFVEMLFALAISEIAIDIGNFNWNHSTVSLHNIHVLAHLTLATYILASSWIGWRTSKSPGHLEEIQSVFDLQFLILLLDILIVVFYFIIIKGVDKFVDGVMVQMPVPNATVESFWSMCIFAAYLVWDFLTTILTSRTTNKIKSPFLNWKYKSTLYPSVGCLLISIVIHYFIARQATSSIAVTFVDISLLLLFVVFRGFKDKITKTVNGVNQQYFYYLKVIVAKVLPVIGILIIVAALLFGWLD